MKVEAILKLGLAALLFLCLADMPYGYYLLVRFLAMLVFAYLAYISYYVGDGFSSFIYGALILLFQPMVKISLGREIWNIVDVIIGVGLLVTVFRSFNQSSSGK